MLLGAGMVSSQTLCAAPAICDRCHAFTVLNVLRANPLVELLRRPRRCSSCGGQYRSYDDPALREPSPSGRKLAEVFSWRLPGASRTFRLYDAGYLCPGCGEFTLRFENVGYWD
jgi:hypothetical protein